jgi:4-hydroxybenzoate polyprenyltransferase
LRAGSAPWTLLELLHPIPSVFTTVAAVGFAWIFGIGPNDPRFWWIAGIMLLAQFSISALNEWADADLDRQAGRRRPIPLGLLSPGTALNVAIVCALGAFLLSAISNLGALPLLLVGIGVACGWAYDLWLKPTPLSFLPFAIAFPLMPFWIGLIAGRPAGALAVLFIGGAPLAAAIHLADAIPDRDTDRAAGLNSLAVALGRPAAELVAVALLLAGSLVSITALLRLALLRHVNSSGLTFAIVVAAAAWVALSLAIRNTKGRSAQLVGKWLLIAAAALAALPLVITANVR